MASPGAVSFMPLDGAPKELSPSASASSSGSSGLSGGGGGSSGGAAGSPAAAAAAAAAANTRASANVEPKHERSASMHRKLMKAIEASPRTSAVLEMAEEGGGAAPAEKSYRRNRSNTTDRRERERLGVPKESDKQDKSPNATMRQRQPSKFMGGETTRGRRGSGEKKVQSRKLSGQAEKAKASIILPPKKKRAREAVGQYLLGDLLGSGQFGKVYRGVNSENGEFVAIKQLKANVMDDNAVTAFESEISLLQKLNHENIVRYHGVVRTTDHVNLIIEYCDGGCTTDIVKKFGNFPEHLCAVYIKQVMRGLVYLHSQGVVHRDIKGANILLTKSGSVKLADFGISTSVNSQSDAGMGMDMGIGSPYWMSPEVIQMEVQPTEKSDIWSVGSTIVELITGHPPYHEYHPMGAIVKCVQDDHPPLPTNISAHLEDFLLRCFQKDIDARASAAELLEHPWLQLKEDAKKIESVNELKATIKTLNEGFSSESKIHASMESLTTEDQATTTNVRVYGETIRSDAPFKTTFVTSSTVCEEVVQIILRKYQYKGDINDFALFEDRDNGELRRLNDNDVLMQIIKAWNKDQFHFKLSLRRKPETLKHTNGTLKVLIKRPLLKPVWRDRFVIFDAEDRFFAIFKSEDDQRFPEVCVYHLGMITAAYEVTNDVATRTYEFHIKVRGVPVCLRADSYQSMMSWLSIVQGACNLSPMRT